MPKLAWVALPLLLALALLAWAALRHRLPSRLSLNVASSLLLLVYLTTTAGLGIFWVANQQLPVFDWHYLFGYATVLLLGVHLAFNLPLVWRWWRRRRGAAPAPAAAAPIAPRPDAPTTAARRGALTLALGAAVAGVAFWLGLRHGRTELRLTESPDGTVRADEPARAADTGAVDSAAGPARTDIGSADAAALLVERFHAFSAHSRAGALRRAPSVAWGDPPAPFKRYPGAPRIALPPRTVRLEPAPHAPQPLASGRPDLATLSALLWHVAGITADRGGLQLRASPSSGALFATELYLAAIGIDGLAPGLWHHDAERHALERLPGSLDALAAAAPDSLAGASAVVLATAIFRRSGHKYRDRTYRYVLADLGHALENLTLAASALHLEARFAASFDEARAAAALAVDEAEEGVLAWISLHGMHGLHGQRPLPPAAQRNPSAMQRRATAPAQLTARNDRQTGSESWHRPAMDNASAERLGITGMLHRATSLRIGAPAAARTGASSPASPVAAGPLAAGSGATGQPPQPVPLPPAPEALFWTGPDRLLPLIARRRSIRRFAQRAIGLDALAALLAALPTMQPWSMAIRIDLVALAVDGLAPGAWRYQPGRHRMLPRRVPVTAADGARTLRHRARAAALDQDVIGDAAAVLVLSLDRAALARDAAGVARGYRHAFLEAGRLGERLYLAAGAQGLGVCGVGAFYDAEAEALIGTPAGAEWVLHFAAIGVPG